MKKFLAIAIFLMSIILTLTGCLDDYDLGRPYNEPYNEMLPEEQAEFQETQSKIYDCFREQLGVTDFSSETVYLVKKDVVPLTNINGEVYDYLTVYTAEKPVTLFYADSPRGRIKFGFSESTSGYEYYSEVKGSWSFCNDYSNMSGSNFHDLRDNDNVELPYSAWSVKKYIYYQ